MVGMNKGGVVDNCTNKSHTQGNSQVGGIVGHNQGVVFDCSNSSNIVIGTNSDVGGIVGNNSGTVQNCYNRGDIRSLNSSEGNCFGGIVGNNSGTVSVCYNEGEVLGYQYVGGVVGYSANDSDDSFVKSCYNIGSVGGETDIGGIIGNDGNVSDCYYLSDTETDSHSGTTAKTSAQFASGEVAYLLNGDQATIAWGQDLASNDEYPKFADYSKKVYQNSFCDGSVEYSNTQGAEDTHKEINSYGYCSVCQIKIASASVTIGKDLTMNYYVDVIDETLLAGIQNISMRFTSGNKSMTVALNEQRTDENGLYIFSFTKIPPQCMSDNIKAELLLGETVIASKDEYSVKQNLSNLLKSNADDEKLIQLITDMLYYGAASQNYKDYNLEDLAHENVENIGTPSTALPITTDKKVTKSTSDTAYVSSLTVWFDSVNKIGVKLSTIENVKLKVNGEFVELTSTAYYTSGIYAVQFGDVFEFELYENDELVQTFNYSVNAYVYAMMGKTEADGTTPTEMAELAKALYRYGASAKIYDHIANGKGEHTFEYIDTDENAYVTACVCGHKAMVIDGTFGGKTEGTKNDVDATKDFLETNIDEGISTLIVTGDSMAMIDVGDYTVTVVSEAFFNTSNSVGLTVSNCIDLVLPDATVIAPYSYISTSALRSVIMPKAKDLKSQAFAGCNYIKTMTFGSVIEGLGENVFSDIGDNVGGCDLILHKDQATAAFKPNGNEFGAEIFNSITLK